MKHGEGTAPAKPKDLGIGDAFENLNVKKGTFKTDRKPSEYLAAFAPVATAEKITSLSVDGAAVEVDLEGAQDSSYNQKPRA